jgi:molecular chaperone IbpA
MDTVAALAPMRRASIGFDHFFRVLDHAIKARDRLQYPPYNIEKTNEDAYRLTLAVAGWAPAEITVTARPHLLVVSGQKPEEDGKRYLYRGIPSGSFEHRFDLADDVRVGGAQMANGLLTIELARVLPEAPASRRILITDTAGRPVPRRSDGLRLVLSPAVSGSQRWRTK